MTRFLKRIVMVFLFGLSVGLSLKTIQILSLIQTKTRSLLLTHYVVVENLTVIKTKLLCKLHLVKDTVENNQQIVKILAKCQRYLGTELHSQVGRNYLIIQVVVVHGMRITKIMRMSSLGKMFKKTPSVTDQLHVNIH